MNQVKATPVNGLRIRKENGQLLPAEGALVELNAYWKRRQNDGDVTLTAAPAAVAEPAAKPKK